MSTPVQLGVLRDVLEPHARRRTDGDRPPPAVLHDGGQLRRGVRDEQHLRRERTHLDDAADDARTGHDAVVAAHVVLRADVDRHDAQRRFGVVADHRRLDAVGVRQLCRGEIVDGGDAREPFAQLVVLRAQHGVLTAQVPVVRRELRRAHDVGEAGARAVDDHGQRELKKRARRRDGGRQRRRSTGAREIELEKRDESGHDDRSDYRE
jgi:hypothetical protein